jgi:hypothetical protein
VPVEHGQAWAVPGARPELLSPGRPLIAEAGGRRAGFAIDEVSRVAPLRALAEETGSDLLLDAAPHDGDLIGVIDVAQVSDPLEQAPP